jgi:hypothetical protein
MTGSATIWMGAAGTGGSCKLKASSNYAAGSTSITCNGLSGGAPVVGDIVTLVQCDTGFSGSPCSGTSEDNGGLFVCSFQTTCMTEPSGSGNNASQQQNFVITSVTSNSGTYSIGLNHGLHMPNWAYAQTPVLSWNSFTYDGVGVGIEDMTIYYSGTSSMNWSVQMQNTYASWIKGVRFLGTPATAGIGVEASENGLLLNNYVFADVAIDGNYPPSLHTDTSSDLLILNNILTYGPNWESDGGDIGVVFAYNYMRDGFTLYPLHGPYDHHAYNSFNLIEGNIAPDLTEDDTWGTHDLDTYFRNYSPCSDVPYTTFSQGSNPRSMVTDSYQRFMNVVGNAFGTLGTLSLCPAYQGSSTTSDIIYRISSTDGLVSTSLMRWGNVSVVQQSTDTPANSGVRFVSSEVPSSLLSPNTSFSNFVPSNDILPCSFFLAGYTPTNCTAHNNGGTGLSFWKVCTAWTTFPTSCATSSTTPFPFAGPDVSGGSYVDGYAYSNPAAIAFSNLPVDTTYQKSYTIASSSWSSGTETLTFNSSVLPNGTHLMGAFQLSGVNSACTSGATFNSNNEILMTGSSSTTVQYALASNPGVSCTGTMKFPDVRQFDESVYQDDSSVNPNPPTGLSASVQ